MMWRSTAGSQCSFFNYMLYKKQNLVSLQCWLSVADGEHVLLALQSFCSVAGSLCPQTNDRQYCGVLMAQGSPKLPNKDMLYYSWTGSSIFTNLKKQMSQSQFLHQSLLYVAFWWQKYKISQSAGHLRIIIICCSSASDVMWTFLKLLSWSNAALLISTFVLFKKMKIQFSLYKIHQSATLWWANSCGCNWHKSHSLLRDLRDEYSGRATIILCSAQQSLFLTYMSDTNNRQKIN